MKNLFQLIIVLIAGILFALFMTAEKDVDDTKEFVVSDTDVTARLWNPRGKSDELIAARARFLAQAAETRTDKQKEADKVYMDRYKDAIVINSLMPASVGIIGNTIKSFTDGVERNRRAGVTHVSASVGAFHPAELMYGFIRDTDPVVIMLDLTKVRTTKDIRDAKAENRMTIMYNSQGFDYKMQDLSYVGSLHDKGVNIMNFVYNTENHLATGINFNSDPNNKKGITELGKAFIRLANERGIIVDVSHSSDATAIDAAKVSTRPILASHNNSSVVFNNPRNMSDEGIRAIGATGGAVCVNGVGVFLSEDANAQADTIAEHVQHIADLIGKQGTCYGSDYTHNLEDAMFIQVPMVDQYPPEKGFGAPYEMASIEDIWAIVAVLEDKYKWNEEEIRGFLGENLMRVYEANWISN